MKLKGSIHGGVFFGFIFFLSSPVTFSQINHDYVDHKTFPTNQEFNTGTLFTARNPYNEQLISHFNFSIRFPNTIDLSLGDSPEPYTFAPTVTGVAEHYSIFKLHNEDDLSEEFIFTVKSFNQQAGETGFQYHPDYFAIEYRIDTLRSIVVNSDQTIENTSEDEFLTCLLEYNSAGTPINQRLISHKSPQAARSITQNKEKYFGMMNDQVRCLDFSFRDTIVVTENDVSTQMQSTDWTVYLDARYANESGYSGVLENAGTLFRRDATVIGSKVYRAFEISGSADLDPTGMVSDYSTPDDEQHLILVCYDNIGNVEWTKLIAKFQSTMSNPGFFDCTLLRDGDQLIVEFEYVANGNGEAPSGTFCAINDTETIESGDLLVEWIFRYSPNYIYLINSENGIAQQIYSMNSVDAGGSDFAQARHAMRQVQNFKPGEIMMHFGSSPNGPDDFVIKSLFPEEMTYEEELQPSALRYSEVFVFSTTASTMSDHFIIEFEQVSNNSNIITRSFAPLDNNQTLVSGNIRGTSEMIFPNVPPVVIASSPDAVFGMDAIAIYIEKQTLSVRDQSETYFELHPNPSAEIITIQSSLIDASFRIFNQSGAKVQSGMIRNGIEMIDIASLATGLYLIHLEFEDGQTGVRKFIKN